MKIIKKARRSIESAVNKLRSDIDQGKVEEGFERFKSMIHTEFEEVEKNYLGAEKATDTLLIKIARNKWSLVIVTLTMASVLCAGFFLGSL